MQNVSETRLIDLHFCNPHFDHFCNFMAERVGFEPTVGVTPLRFSRPVH